MNSGRPRIVHVVVAGEIGGAERMLVDLASRPDRTSAEHAVAVLSPNPELVRMMRDAGIRTHDRGPVHEHPAAFLWHSLGPSDVAWLAGVLADERADVVHLHTFASQVLGTRAARRADVPVVRTEHSTRAYEDPSCWPFSRWSLERCDLAVAVSEHVRSVAARRAPWARSKLRIVHNGVDVARFRPAPRREASAAFRFILVGRLEPRKGVDVGIEALAHIPHAALDIVGDGAERPRLEELARSLGVRERVHFLGRLSDPRGALAAADAALCSSREEGLGIALLEAMAMELPVVGFAVGGVPEIVQDGETGWLCDPASATALATCMRDAMTDRAHVQALGRSARRLVTTRFSLDRMCEGYRELYASIRR